MGKLQKNTLKINTMAQPFNSLDDTTRSQMACTFAALLLHDDGTELTDASLKKLLDAAGVNVQAYWPVLFVDALRGQDMGSFLNVSAGSAPVQQAPTGGNAPTDAPKAEAKKEEEPEDEEEDMDLGDLF